jgi:hypothetical protein
MQHLLILHPKYYHPNLYLQVHNRTLVCVSTEETQIMPQESRHISRLCMVSFRTFDDEYYNYN